MITEKLIASRMQFGYICPTPLLEQLVPPQARFHLCLAHLCEDKRYCEFYRKKRERGDMIIMDNSAFEFNGSLEPSKLLDLIEGSGIRPDVIVAPDYPGQPAQKTIDAFLEFQQLLSDTWSEETVPNLMGVPQSEVGDWQGWVESYIQMTELAQVVGMSILGIPNAAQAITGTTDISYNRIWATVWLVQNGIINDQVWHHYLGASSPSEFRIQAQLGVANSLDTSSPIWHGLLGIQYDDSPTGLKSGKSKIPVDFEYDEHKAVHSVFEWPVLYKRIQHNINYVEDSCNR